MKINNKEIHVTIGNFFYSRLIKSYDVKVNIAGNEYYYQQWNSDVVFKIEPVTLEYATAIDWDDVSISVKIALLSDFFPEADIFEKNLFVYGKKIGQQLNADIKSLANYIMSCE